MEFRTLHPNIRIRIVSLFMARLVSNMVFPFMGVYFSLALGERLAGVLLLINLLFAILSGLYGGYIADTMGRKKTMIFTELLQLLAFAVMAVCNSYWFSSAWITYGAMLVQSIAVGMMLPASDSMLIDVSTKENRKFMYRLNYWSLNLSTAIGALVGGFFFDSGRFILFLLLIGVSVINLFLLLLVKDTIIIKKEDKIGSSPLKGMLRNYKVVVKDGQFLMFWFASLLILSLSFQIPNYVTIRLKQEFIPQSVSIPHLTTFHLDGVLMGGWLRSMNTILVILGTFVVSRLIKKIPDAITMVSGLCLYVLGHVILGFSNDANLLMSAVLILTIGELGYVPIKQTILADIAKENLRSSYMAINNMSFQGARMAGALGIILGAMVSSWFMAILYLIAGFIGIRLFYLVQMQFSPKKAVDVQAKV